MNKQSTFVYISLSVHIQLQLYCRAIPGWLALCSGVHFFQEFCHPSYWLLLPCPHLENVPIIVKYLFFPIELDSYFASLPQNYLSSKYILAPPLIWLSVCQSIVQTPKFSFEIFLSSTVTFVNHKFIQPHQVPPICAHPIRTPFLDAYWYLQFLCARYQLLEFLL